MKHKLAIVVIVRNEEKSIQRCLESLKSLGASLNIVHDGICDDATIHICKRFTTSIFVRPFIGEAEPHRAWLYQQLKEDWIFQIDADEYISLETSIGIKKLLSNDDGSIDAFDFIWPYFDGIQYRTNRWPRKRALFRRKAISFIGLPHEIARVNPSRSQNVDLVIDHKPRYDNFQWKNFHKHQKWINLHARLLTDRSTWVTFGSKKEIFPVYYKIVDHPLIFAFPLFSYHFLGLLINGGFGQGYIGIRNSFMQALYWLRLCFRIHFLQRNSNH